MFWILFVDIGDTLIPAMPLLKSSMLCAHEHSAASVASDDVELIEVAFFFFSPYVYLYRLSKAEPFFLLEEESPLELNFFKLYLQRAQNLLIFWALQLQINNFRNYSYIFRLMFTIPLF